MSPVYGLTEVFPLEFDEDQWDQYFGFRDQYRRDVDPGDPPQSHDSLRKSLVANVQHPEADVRIFFIQDSNIY